MTSLCTLFRLASPTVARSASVAWLGGAAALACSDPLPPPAEAAVAISKQISQSPDAAQVCPEVHGKLMFPTQGTLVLQPTTPAATVLNEMQTIDSGVKCSVKGGEGNYDISVEINQSGVDGVGDFRLTGLNVSNGASTSNATLYWLYKGFGFRGPCAVTVDKRPATEENPDTNFVEPGMAKVSFLCDPFANPDGQACRAEGTVFVRNCAE